LAVSFVSTGQNSTTAGVTTISVTIDCTGCDMLVAFLGSTAFALTGMTAAYNGVSMTAITNSPADGSSNTKVWGFYLASPSSGSNSIVFNWTTSSSRISAGGIGLAGSNGTVSNGVVGTGTDAASATIASATGDMVVAGLSTNGGQPWTSTNTSDWNNVLVNFTGAGSHQAGAASVTMSWTRGGGTGNDTAVLAVNLPSTGTAVVTQAPYDPGSITRVQTKRRTDEFAYAIPRPVIRTLVPTPDDVFRRIDRKVIPDPSVYAVPPAPPGRLIATAYDTPQLTTNYQRPLPQSDTLRLIPRAPVNIVGMFPDHVITPVQQLRPLPDNTYRSVPVPPKATYGAFPQQDVRVVAKLTPLPQSDASRALAPPIPAAPIFGWPNNPELLTRVRYPGPGLAGYDIAFTPGQLPATTDQPPIAILRWPRSIGR